MGPDFKKLDNIQLSKELNYNSEKYTSTLTGVAEFNKVACNNDCVKDYNEQKLDDEDGGEIPPFTQVSDSTPVGNGAIRRGECFYRIENGLENTQENRQLICGCNPWYELNNS